MWKNLRIYSEKFEKIMRKRNEKNKMRLKRLAGFAFRIELEKLLLEKRALCAHFIALFSLELQCALELGAA